MSQRQHIIRNHPQTIGVDTRILEQCVTACLDCAATCRSCADICVAGDQVTQRRYLTRTLMDCADVCTATAKILLRQTEPNLSLVRRQLEACEWTVRVCEAECTKWAGKPGPYRVCSEACSQCKQLCAKFLGYLRSGLEVS